MNDRLLVETLRARDPHAPAAVYDAYAERVFGYCWFRLRDRDTAQVALRDTFVVAEAHIRRLRDPDRFGPWLYALARAECDRRLDGEPSPPDVPVATHDQDDVDLRLIAWNAVTCLPPNIREVLDLRFRHRLPVVDLATVLGRSCREVEDAVEQAGDLLEAALSAEILAYRGPYECSGRAEILRDRRGELTDDLRERLVRHGLECTACARHRPRSLAPEKVCGLLPHVPPPPTLRLRVVSCFTVPDLAGYRLFVATRVTGFGSDGFPARPRRTPVGSAVGARTFARRWSRALAAICVAGVVLGLTIGSLRWFGLPGDRPVHGVASSETVRPAEISPRANSPVLHRVPSPVRPVENAYLPVSATFPLGARRSALPPIALNRPGRDRRGRLRVTPGRLDLGAGRRGRLTVRAVGGDVDWLATVSGPVRPIPAGGPLNEGDSETISVRVLRDGPGSAAISFAPGGRTVTVTWNDSGGSVTGTPSDSRTTPARPAPPATSPTSRPPTSPAPSRRPTPSRSPVPASPSPSRPSVLIPAGDGKR